MIRDRPVNWNDDRYDDVEADLENVAVAAEACGGADELAISSRSRMQTSLHC